MIRGEVAGDSGEGAGSGPMESVEWNMQSNHSSDLAAI